MAKTDSKHAAGDALFKNAPEAARKLHEQFKKSVRTKDRADWMKQRTAENSQFQR